MQGQKSSIDSFREAIEITEEAYITRDEMSNQQSSVPPVEQRWSSYVSADEAHVNVVQNFAAAGESSGSSIGNSNVRDESSGARRAGGSLTEEALFPSRGILSLGGNQSQGTSSNLAHQNVNLNEGYVGNGDNTEPSLRAASLGPNLYLSSRPERELSDSWGLSCKRKAVEGTSGQSCAGGSSSSSAQPENRAWNTGPVRITPSRGLRLSSPPISNTPLEPPNPRTRIAARSLASDPFPSPSLADNARTSSRQEAINPIPFNIASAGTARRFSLRREQLGEPLEPGVTAGALEGQSHMMLGSAMLGNNPPFPWNGASSSRVGGMPSSFPFGERGGDEPSLRRIPRTNVDQTSSTSASGNASTSLGIPYTSRTSPNNHLVPSSAWAPQHRQRAVEFSPWSLFPADESPPITRSGQTEPVLPGASSLRDVTISMSRSNQSRQQSYLRSSLTERHGENAPSISNSLRALSADVEGRRRLISEIRQVLHAMRRGENLQIEDYMLLDPFVFHDMAEMHDRHRDMRLDVDNMSYEELLALGERIGDVKTGLSEGTILKLMKRRRYQLVEVEPGANPERCCICQEEYLEGDDVGAIDCGHEFHPDCVKTWLTKKNTCPKCKTTALRT